MVLNDCWAQPQPKLHGIELIIKLESCLIISNKKLSSSWNWASYGDDYEIGHEDKALT